MCSQFVVLMVSLMLFSIIALSVAQAKPGCPGSCGNVSIHYPFGVEGCNLNSNFLITCNDSYNPPKPFLRKSTFEVTEISVHDGTLNMLKEVARDCYDLNRSRDEWRTSFSLAEFTISKSKNRFTVIGCNSYAYLRGTRNGKSYRAGCMSVCAEEEFVDYESYSGSGCCQMEIPDGLNRMAASAYTLNKSENVSSFSPCTYAFIVEKNAFKFSPEYLKNMPPNKEFPVTLDWSINEENTTIYEACKENASANKSLSDNVPGFRCICKPGFEGNPYLGCHDTDECKLENLNNCSHKCTNLEGSYKCSCPRWYSGDGRKDGEGCKLDQLPILLIILGVGILFVLSLAASSTLYLFFKHRRLVKLKEKFFRQNGGLILQQRLSGSGGSSNMRKIFTAEELKEATDNYDESRIIGKGGFGTVYKGILTDKREVAIKKSTIVDQNQVEQFINEVDVLSEINHRNVVKLLGCCLETQVPLLVYEFISNGTLFDHIHNKTRSAFLPWHIRLKIAAETAGALSYLHSTANIPIIHRDVKPTNILLDSHFTAKVSDFGASRFAPLDETQLSTMVQGTLGYLDPEYLHTSQLTEKSDVYSFGVVLVELLTGMKALCFDRPEPERSLAMYFVLAMKQDRLFEILDNDVVKEGKSEQLREVAILAKQCLALKSEDRPSMKEVAMELEGMILMDKHPWHQSNSDETEYLLMDIHQEHNGLSEGTSSGYDSIRDHVVLPLGDGR